MKSIDIQAILSMTWLLVAILATLLFARSWEDVGGFG